MHHIVLGIHEPAEGERILVKISNDAGGTPYAGDRELQRDAVGIFQTFHWPS